MICTNRVMLSSFGSWVVLMLSLNHRSDWPLSANANGSRDRARDGPTENSTGSLIMIKLPSCFQTSSGSKGHSAEVHPGVQLNREGRRFLCGHFYDYYCNIPAITHSRGGSTVFTRYSLQGRGGTLWRTKKSALATRHSKQTQCCKAACLH